MRAQLVGMILASAVALASGAVRAADFNADGEADVVWRLPGGSPLVWQMDGLSARSRTTIPMSRGADSSLVGTGNFFDSPNSAGLAWVSSRHELELWQIGANSQLVQKCVPTSNIASDWELLGLGDIDGNGIDDVLWRRHSNDTVVAQIIDGCNQPGLLVLGGTVDPGWDIAGMGDVDANGIVDLLWLNATDNTMIEWLVSEDGVVAETSIDMAGQSGWDTIAVADFNADGKSDVMWRESSGDALVVWVMNGSAHTALAVAAASNGVFAVPGTIFNNGFDTSRQLAPPLDADWTVLDAADYDGDDKAGLLLAHAEGAIAIWKMQGATVDATNLISLHPNTFPLSALTGWRMPLDRPHITKVDNNVTVQWVPLPGSPSYKVYGSASNYPAATGTVVSSAPPPLTFPRNGDGFAATDRYFAVSAVYHGLELPPSPEAYIVEFDPNVVQYWGAMSVTDLNQDGCQDLATVRGDCHGAFEPVSEAGIGLGPLRANGRAYRDVRFADFNGDKILDAIANVYSCDVDACGGDDPNSTLLLFIGNADGYFIEDTAFRSMSVPGGGFGETIAVADFNNDTCLDIFLPKYTSYAPSEHNFLLINDCSGHFADMADSAGVDQRNVVLGLRPEGAQALDIDSDGWIDIYCASQLFINNGNLTFTNVGSHHNDDSGASVSPWGLPAQFDEGAKFIDLDNSGQLALVLNTSSSLRVFKFDGADQFVEQNVIPDIYMNASWGLTASDVDGDGRSDLIVAGGIDQSLETASKYATLRNKLTAASAEGDTELDDVLEDEATPNGLPQLLVNRGQFVRHDFFDDGLSPETRTWNDLQTFGDFDASGTADIVSRFRPVIILMNKATDLDVITVTVLGTEGEHNQQGRLVRVSPVVRPDVVMTQVIDSGSGYMSNGPYDLTFPTPYPGTYTVRVRFASGVHTTTVRAGTHVRMYANDVTTTVSR